MSFSSEHDDYLQETLFDITPPLFRTHAPNAGHFAVHHTDIPLPENNTDENSPTDIFDITELISRVNGQDWKDKKSKQLLFNYLTDFHITRVLPRPRALFQLQNDENSHRLTNGDKILIGQFIDESIQNEDDKKTAHRLFDLTLNGNLAELEAEYARLMIKYDEQYREADRQIDLGVPTARYPEETARMIELKRILGK